MLGFGLVIEISFAHLTYQNKIGCNMRQNLYDSSLKSANVTAQRAAEIVYKLFKWNFL